MHSSAPTHPVLVLGAAPHARHLQHLPLELRCCCRQVIIADVAPRGRLSDLARGVIGGGGGAEF
jgi:hypothetical protein